MAEQLYIYAGNTLGEVYIYTVNNMSQAFQSDPDRPLVKAELSLVDMVLTHENFVVRGLKQVEPTLFGACTEGNKV